MPNWAQIISDALDILKFDGAVQDTLAELREKWEMCIRDRLLRNRSGLAVVRKTEEKARKREKNTSPPGIRRIVCLTASKKFALALYLLL